MPYSSMVSFEMRPSITFGLAQGNLPPVDQHVLFNLSDHQDRVSGEGCPEADAVALNSVSLLHYFMGLEPSALEIIAEIIEKVMGNIQVNAELCVEN